MSREHRHVLALVSCSGAAVLALAATALPAPASAGAQLSSHVLLLSVDGMHQSDLATYVAAHPSSALAGLVAQGRSFSAAQTPVPSDSFPGIIGQLTGGNPRTTGLYYDVSYDRTLLPAGTTSCRGMPRGAAVNNDESLDRDVSRLDAGQGLPSLPADILQMTGQPRQVIDPGQLPVDPRICRPVYPHSYLQVNTVFEVARAHGLRTAWADKHPAYDILQGPSGQGIQDLFTPEIASQADGLPAGTLWTDDNAATQRYDSYKVQAVVNEIDGFDHSRRHRVGTPAVFGMNFQTVSTAQKLPVSGGEAGGYLADGRTPGPVLAGAFAYIDRQVATMRAALVARHLDRSTTIVLSAKHGQSPMQPQSLLRIPDGPILDGLDAAWAIGHLGAAPLVAAATDDDAMIIWLSDRSQAAADFAKSYLLSVDGEGNDIHGAPVPYTASGLRAVYAGRGAAAYFGTSVDDVRVPSLYALARHGVVFTSKMKKISEHGGADPQDRDVPLVLAGAGITAWGTSGLPVHTTQVAPTILRLLGISPVELQAVRIEHTPVLPLGQTQP